jgi:hypothetical protein
MYTLVTWSTNWADEMDIEGFKIFKKEDWDKYKAHVALIKHPFDICIGTNEEIDYLNGKQLLSDLTIQHITEAEFDVINKLFGTSFGHHEFTYAMEME